MADTVGIHEPTGLHRTQEHLLCGVREPEVHGVHGVTVVPCPAQLLDEARATGDRERHQLRHAPEPTGLPCEAAMLRTS